MTKAIDLSDRKGFRRTRTHLLSSEVAGMELAAGPGQVLMGMPAARPTRFRMESRGHDQISPGPGRDSGNRDSLPGSTAEPATRELHEGGGSGNAAAEMQEGRCSAGFQPAVSPTSSRQGADSAGRREEQMTVCGLEARDTADWKSALQLTGNGVPPRVVDAGKRPKLAIFCYEPQAGAIGQYTAALAPQCADHGVEVHVFSRTAFDCAPHPSLSPGGRGWGEGGVKIHVLGDDPASGLLQSAEDFTARARAAFTAALGADAAEVTALCHEWTCIGVLTELRPLGVRTILSLHSLECQRSDLSSETSRSILEVERLGLAVAESILIHEQAAADAARRLLPACGERLVHLRQPFPAAEFDSRVDPGAVKARFQIGPVDPTILFVGNLDERHGPDILMRSVPAVLKNHPQARFVFVGDGTLLWPLRVYSRYLLLDHAMRFAGHLEGQPLRELIRAADIVAVPSREWTGEWQILAAWAAQRAVVATHNVGAALLDHERDGVLVYPHESSLVWGLERLLYDHALRQNAGLSGNRKLLARFGQASAARQIEELMGVQGQY